eukprot:259303_1
MVDDDMLNLNKKKPRKQLKYFELMNRRDIFIWYTGCILDFLLNIIILGTMFVGGYKWFHKIKQWNKKTTRIQIHHRNCYGDIKIISKDRKLAVNGITMSQYFDVYEQHKKRYISRQDRITLNRLTANTLFCPHCYQSFIYNEDNKNKIEDELVTPFIPLFDYISALMFVFIPIAWIPILIIVGADALKEYLFDLFITTQVNQYSNQDYDRNYFPQFIPSQTM